MVSNSVISIKIDEDSHPLLRNLAKVNLVLTQKRDNFKIDSLIAAFHV